MEYLKRCPPREAGADEQLVGRLFSELKEERYGLHALMLLKGGRVIGEEYLPPYPKEARRALFSVSKSFAAVALLFAFQEGLLSPEDRVISFFPDKLSGPVCENMAKMKVKHLLSMTSGLSAAPHAFARHRRDDVVNDFPYSYEDRRPDFSLDWTKDFLRAYVAREPGQRFLYSNGCTYMLSAILGRAAGTTLKDYLLPRLFTPLGIKDVGWQVCPLGNTVGAWGLSLSLEELAVFAQFLLDGGVFQGKRLLEEKYIKEMTSPKIPVGAKDSFGWQVWLPGEEAFAGIGAFGQMYLALPRLNAVFLMFGGSRGYMKTVDILLKALPAALSPGAASAPPPPVQGLPAPEGVSSWDMPALLRFSGKRYRFGDNDLGIKSIRFEFGPEDFITLNIGGEESRLKIGFGYWTYGETPVAEDEHTDVHTQLLFRRAALAGAWQGERYILHLVFYETCYISRLEITFFEHGVELRHSRNVGFVENADCLLVGREE